MATSYALPINGSVLAQESHGSPGSHTHARSHHRKAAPERLPLSRSQIKAGGAQDMAGTTRLLTSNGGHSHSHSVPVANAIDMRQTRYHHFHSTVQETIPEADTPHKPSPFPSFELVDPAGAQQMAQMQFEETPRGCGFPRIDENGHLQGRERAHSELEDPIAPSITTREIVTAMLLPLPYILLSQARSSIPSSDLDAKTASADEIPRVIYNTLPNTISTFASVCLLTGVTLLFIGVAGRVRGSKSTLDRRRHDLGRNAEKSSTRYSTIKITGQRIVSRLLAIGLPYYAASKIGGVRVGLLLLVAITTDLGKINGKSMDSTALEDWKRFFSHHWRTILALVVQFLFDLSGLTSVTKPWPTVAGYVALSLAILVLPPPYPNKLTKALYVSSPLPKSGENTTLVATPLATPFGAPPVFGPTMPENQAPLISTTKDTNLTLIAGGLATATALLLFSAKSTTLSSSFNLRNLLVASAAATTLIMVDTQSIKTKKKVGLAAGLAFILGLHEILSWEPLVTALYQVILAAGAWLAVSSESASNLPGKRYRRRADSFMPKAKYSRFTGLLLSLTQNWTLLHSILAEKDSRRIFYFMCLNFGFMLVQTFYGLVTGSLGLLSDSIHMLFDCLALVVGLCAAVMSKWPPSIKFPHGFGKMDTLAGFANGIFLMLISIEIVYEALERLTEGSKMQRIGELLTVSSMGLAVNLVGMFAFGHAHHGHGHGGHSHEHDHPHEHDRPHEHDHPHEHSHDHGHSHGSHDHSHGKRNHLHVDDSRDCHDTHHHTPTHTHLARENIPLSPLPFNMPSTPSKPPPLPIQSKSPPAHHHGNENMHGIFLHILADTLGSVAVVISTICIHYTGWAGFDPLASCLIAILIFASAIPLVTSSARSLLLTVPEATEFDIRDVLVGVGALKGVSDVAAPRFWMSDGEGAKVGGVMHVIAERGHELEEVRERATWFLAARNMDVLVQVEREGEGRCWCGGGLKN